MQATQYVGLSSCLLAQYIYKNHRDFARNQKITKIQKQQKGNKLSVTPLLAQNIFCRVKAIVAIHPLKFLDTNGNRVAVALQ